MADVLKDFLRSEGVNFKGFGVIPKFVMMDVDISLEAKAIYAYFCSFAGSGNTAFPSRNKILSDLSISKDAYYKHFKMLTENGYITVERPRNNNVYGKNVYTLVSNPKKLKDAPVDEDSQGKIYSRLAMTGVKSKGYGIIPKSVMIDERLPIKAKGIYAYFCSLTGAGNSAFPKHELILHHLQISSPTYYRTYPKLIALNYITVVQRHANGRLSVNDYYLNDAPDEANTSPKTIEIFNLGDSQKQNHQIQDIERTPLETKEVKKNSVKNGSGNLTTNQLQKQDIEKQDVAIQYVEKQDIQIQHLNQQDVEKQDANTNNFINNNFYKNHSLNQQTVSHLTEGGDKKISLIKRELLQIKCVPYSYANDFSIMTAAIHAMTDWDILHPSGYTDQFQQSIYNLMNAALVDMCTSTRAMKLKTSLVTNIQVIDQLNMIARFEDDYIDISDITEPAMQNYIQGAENNEIRNPLQYMKACIWDAMLVGNINMYQAVHRLSL